VKCPGYFQETKFLDEGVGLRRKFQYVENSYETVAGSLFCEQSQHHGSQMESPWQSALSGKGRNDDYRKAQGATQNQTDVSLYQSADGEPQQKVQPAATIGPHSFVNCSNIVDRERATSSDVSIPTIGGSPEEYSDAPPAQEEISPTLVSFGAESLNNDQSLSENVQLLFPTKSKTLSALNTCSQVASKVEEVNSLEIMFLIRHFSETVGPW